MYDENNKQENQHESDRPGPADCGCGPDGIDAAEKAIAEARRDIERAQATITEGNRELQEAMAKLQKAEEDLELERHKIVHFEVDAEPFETCDSKQTPNHIIKTYGERNPSENYLVKIAGHGHDVSYKDKGEVPILIKEGDRFQIISIGPAPVSDGSPKTGADVFAAGLRAAGYAPEKVTNKAGHLFFKYQVPAGKFAGQHVVIGLVVPPDFPLTAPGGPHVSPRFHPNVGGGIHPTGGIHSSEPFAGVDGLEWQYWSRPFNEWGQTKKTVGIYLGHLRRLWETQ